MGVAVGAGGRFVGVGVVHYGDPRLVTLPQAIVDVEEVWRFLEPTFEGEPLRDASKRQVEEHLQTIKNSLPGGGALVLMWCGHGVSAPPHGVQLMTTDSDADAVSGLAIGQVVGPCVFSGADQVLVVVDTCFSGAAVPTATEVATALMAARPPDSDHVWVGVLASCSASDTAVDGRLGAVLGRLVREGPTIPDLRRRWSAHNVRLRGDDLCDAVVKEWECDDHRPRFRSDGSAWWMLPNPLYRPGAPHQVVEHLLRAARGGSSEDERSWFTGRTGEVDTVVGWVRGAQPGVFVVTGSAGTGKSAVVGRVVSLSDPVERERLLRPGRTWWHSDPDPGSVRAHAHARALTADRLADLLHGQLRVGFLTGADSAAEERRNAADLLGAVQRAVEAGQGVPVVVVDGLDEARGEAFTIAGELVRLARWATVIVSTRPVPGRDGSLLETLDPVAVLDLDSAESQQAGRAALREYVISRLEDVGAPDMDPRLVGAHLVATTGAQDRPFLLARVITDQLRADPVGTSRSGWEDAVAASIETAFDLDLAGVEPPTHRDLPAETSAGAFARTVLLSLTWAFGAGFPEDEWRVVAGTLTGSGVLREDVSWVLDRLGRYVVQDGEAGVAVYRIAHQSLADHLRPPFVSNADRVFDPAARVVTAALLGYYDDLLGEGRDAQDPGYLWRYAWRHSAQAGAEGVDMLRTLARSSADLRNDVALAAAELAERLRFWGYRADALSLAQEAATTYRGLAADNPAFLPDLAGALNNLGVRYSALGRPADALPPTQEAATTYRGLAADNPAFLPDLASTLNNLGVRYSALGRPEQAGVAWAAALDDMTPGPRATLLVFRSRSAQAGTRQAAEWLSEALGLAEDDPVLARAVHDEARRHDDANPAAWRATWEQVTGTPLPGWASVDRDLLATARSWTATATYPDEHAFLTEHDELLHDGADLAVEETLLGLAPEEAGRYRQLRETARRDGVDAAYRPTLLGILVQQFVTAGPQERRALLATRREDLLDDQVLSIVNTLADRDDVTAQDRQAQALLGFAVGDPPEDLLDAVFAAITQPDRFGDLLMTTATRGGPARQLGALAALALTHARSEPEAAAGLVFTAVASADAGALEEARRLLDTALELAPDHRDAWSRQLLALRTAHPAVLDLLDHLLTPTRHRPTREK